MKNKMRREMRTFALTMTGLGSIIGSGWLFGSWKAASVAGPAAVYSWLIGMVLILIIGLTFAELGSMFPAAGGMVRYGQFSHGSLVGFITGWANWIAIVSVIPVEAVASTQYLSSWNFSWAHQLYDGNELTALGLFIAALLVFVYFLLNYFTIQLFAKVNSMRYLNLLSPHVRSSVSLQPGFTHITLLMYIMAVLCQMAGPVF
ncbi:amino acid transporter [Sporolactobacillus inulinus]|uniref:Amino acid transporter n=1 Tax=Sporolactobacillus inulinus TaxID=2078 RepID=A0A4Y1Z8D4_9BACL|nr:amino acid transporter [Sporolactobacillus inulinus]